MRQFPAIAAAVLTLLFGVATARADGADDADACIRASDEGQKLRDHGDYSHARTAFIQCVSPNCPAIIRTTCAQWLDDLAAREATVVFAATDEAGHDLNRVQVTMDGHVIMTAIDGRAVTADPGPHRVHFEAEGRRSVDLQVVVRSGEKNRVVSVVLEGATARPAPPEHATSNGRSWTLPIVTGSLAAAFFITDAALVASAANDLHALQQSPCASTRTCDQGSVDSIQRRLDISKAAFVLGVVSAGAFVVTLVRSAESSSAPALAVSAAPTIGGGAAVLHGAF